jgi:hypothetical protein
LELDMIAPKEFRKHAAECRRMARFVRDQANKERWTSLADRWIVAAELAEHKLAEHENFTLDLPRLPPLSLH